MRLALAVALLLSAPVAARAAALIVTFEAPGVQSAQQSNLCAGLPAGSCWLWTETFDGRARGSQEGLRAGFGPGVSGTYDRAWVDGPNQYGSAGGGGNHMTLVAGVTNLALSGPGGEGLNYFGLWWSALDTNNTLNFYAGDNLLFSYSAVTFLEALDHLPSAEREGYFGNPADGSGSRRNAREPYAFVNFHGGAARFDRVEFVQGPWGGFESDNHTVGLILAAPGGGADAAAVPAPGGLAAFGAGLVALGAVLARRRRAARTLGQARGE